MTKKILAAMLLAVFTFCMSPLSVQDGLHAETIRVLRFVPVAGAESEVALSSLQKVVFAQDSVVLISAADGEVAPMYKYDYRSILFAESSAQQAVAPTTEQPPQAEKFIRDGQLFIRYKGTVYNVQGGKVKIED